MVTIKKELEKFQNLYHHNFLSIKASEELNNILNRQRSPQIKFGLGYGQESSSSQSENKRSINLIKFQSSKQSESSKIKDTKACIASNKNESNNKKEQVNVDLISKPV